MCIQKEEKKTWVCLFSLLICLLSSAGTRIIYDRKFLLDRRNSPIAQTPPAHLPVIPGVTSQKILNENKKNEVNNINNHDGKPGTGLSFHSLNLKHFSFPLVRKCSCSN